MPCGGIAAGRSVMVPVLHCTKCGLSWTDFRAEDAEQELIRKIQVEEVKP
jgi:hypothetical protein